MQGLVRFALNFHDKNALDAHMATSRTRKRSPRLYGWCRCAAQMPNSGWAFFLHRPNVQSICESCEPTKTMSPSPRWQFLPHVHVYAEIGAPGLAHAHSLRRERFLCSLARVGGFQRVVTGLRVVVFDSWDTG
jgi:hypothetical protein